MSADRRSVASARGLLALLRAPDLALGPDLDPATFATPWRALVKRLVPWLEEAPGSGSGDPSARLAAFLRSIPDDELMAIGAISRTWLLARLQQAEHSAAMRDPLDELAEVRCAYDDANDADLAADKRYDRHDTNDRSPSAPPLWSCSVVSVVPETVWPAAMGAAAFHGLAGEFVALVEPHTEADSAALLLDLLVQAGHAIGRTAHVAVGAVNHYPNLYAVIVGASGAAGRKGTAYSEARRLLELAAPEAAERIVGGAASGEGIIWNVRDPIYGTDKKTGEEIEVDPGVADKRLLLREAEFSQVLRVAGRDSNTTSIVLREAWDGGDRLQTLAKNSPATATGAHVSMLADITPAELRRELTATDRANGFANRILWCCSRRSKELPDGGRVDLEALDALAARLGGMLAGAHLLGPVARDEEARARWHEIYGLLTREQPGLLGALLARAEAQVVRLSLIYAVLDGAQTIRREHLQAALAVWDYCERSAECIFGDALGDTLADDLHEALVGALPRGFTRTEIRDLLGRNRRGSDVDRALSLLERHGFARAQRERTGGRPAVRWYAVTTKRAWSS